MSDANRCSPHNAIECPACEFDALRAEVASLKARLLAEREPAPEDGQCQYRTALLEANRRRHEWTDALRDEVVQAMCSESERDAARVRELEADDEHPRAQPIGQCPRCGVPVYADGGFCGVCGARP
jgi:hypothetical protein